MVPARLEPTQLMRVDRRRLAQSSTAIQQKHRLQQSEATRWGLAAKAAGEVAEGLPRGSGSGNLSDAIYAAVGGTQGEGYFCREGRPAGDPRDNRRRRKV